MVIRYLVAIAALLCNLAAQAGTPALGFEIGVSSAEQVKASLVKQTRVIDGGTNKYSGGVMLKTDGSAYEIEGLNEVLYIFDDQKRLAAVILSMDQGRFEPVYQALANKYKVSTKQRPFVGNQFARFKTPDTVIEMDAPHMSFAMEVRYVRNDLMAKFNTQSSAESDAKKKREAAKF